jgi:AraC-like DNA-binding protein
MAEYWNTARTVQMVVDACAVLGVDTSAVLAAAGIDAAVVADPEGRVSLDQMRVFWSEAVSRSGDPAIGLHAAQHLSHGHNGLIDYLFGYASTVGEGIGLMMRYLPLVNNWIVPAIEVDDDDATLSLDVVWREIPRTTAEYVFAMLVVRGRAVWRVDWAPALIRFEFPAPRPPERLGEHARVLGCGIEFGADATQMIVAREVWDTEVKTADPGLVALLQAQADEMLQRLPAASGFVDDVRQVVRVRLAEPGHRIEQVAAQLGMSPRTLQRRLAEGGTSYAAVVDQVRLEAAKQALADSTNSLAEIAFLIGFEEQSSFSRAFKRWTGLSPSEHRALLS